MSISCRRERKRERERERERERRESSLVVELFHEKTCCSQQIDWANGFHNHRLFSPKKRPTLSPCFHGFAECSSHTRGKLLQPPPQYVWVETHNCQSKAKETAVTDRTTVEAREREKLHCVSVSFLDVSAKDGGGEEERE